MEDMLRKIAQGNNEIWVAAYREGIKEGIRRYVVWKNGQQFVGVMQQPLKEVLASIDDEIVVRSND